jgi:integrase
MENRTAFTIPLSDAAVMILRRKAIEQGISLTAANAPENHDRFVFTNEVGGPLREFDRMMEKIGYGAYDAHGFRTSYRMWAAEHLMVGKYGHEIVEQVLAHKIRDEAEAAYARAQAFGPRRELMEAWATACGAVATLNVVA